MAFDMFELLTLYDITSFSFPKQDEDLMEEIIEKATRLFGVRRLALVVRQREERKCLGCWGFQEEGDVWSRIDRGQDNSFLYSLGANGDLGLLYLEQKHPLSHRDRRLYTIFARSIEGILERKQIEEKMRASEQEKAVILDSISELIAFQNPEHRIVWLNRAAAKSVNMVPEQLVGRYCYEIWHHRSSPCEGCPVVKVLKTGQPEEGIITSPDGRIWYIRGYPVKDEKGNVTGVVEASVDITERKRAEEALQESERRYREILVSMEEGYYEVDLEGNITFCNDAACRLLGYAPGELVGVSFREISQDPEAVYSVFKQIYSSEHPHCGFIMRAKHKDGSLRLIELSIAPIKNKKGKIIGFRGIGRDVTERKQYEEKLVHLSLHDQVTGLYNRAYFEEQLNHLNNSREYPITIIAFDLDRLKLINDAMGHAQGDELLKICASILKKCLRSGDILARIGGDEFVAILPHSDEKSGDAIVRRVRRALEEHNQQHPQLPLSLSIGVATATSPGQCLYEVFKKADNLMFRDKLYRSTSARSQLVNTLLQALAEKDYLSQGHSKHLQDLCVKLGERIGLSSQQLANLALLVKVHDLGKIGIPGSILYKNGPLTDEERKIMQQHPEKGYRIASHSPELAPIAKLILHHHERWDGSGYPVGLKGEEIPIECRILAIAAAFDAITNDRSYSKAEALEEIKRRAGTQFDPKLVEEFAAMLEELKNFPRASNEPASA